LYNIAIELWRIEKTYWAILVESEHRWETEVAAGNPKLMRLLETTYSCSQALHATAKCPAPDRRWGNAYSHGNLAALNLLIRDEWSQMREEKDQLKTLKRDSLTPELKHYSSILGDTFLRQIQINTEILEGRGDKSTV
jgi:hypothetical protein